MVYVKLSRISECTTLEYNTIQKKGALALAPTKTQNGTLWSTPHERRRRRRRLFFYHSKYVNGSPSPSHCLASRKPAWYGAGHVSARRVKSPLVAGTHFSNGEPPAVL